MMQPLLRNSVFTNKKKNILNDTTLTVLSETLSDHLLNSQFKLYGIAFKTDLTI